MFAFIYAQPLFSLFIVAVISIILYAILNVIFDNIKWLRILGLLSFVISLLCIFYSTIFVREGGNADLELSPFYSFTMAKIQPEMYRSVFMNALLYVPFGIFMPYLLSHKYKIINLLITVLSALFISCAVEGLQYFYTLGRCETDDVIFNTLGAFIGASGYWLYGYLIKESDKMENKLSELQNTLCELCANTLFEKKISLPENIDATDVLSEAKKQTVLPIAVSGLKNQSVSTENLNNIFLRSVVNNIRVSSNHIQIASILSENEIKYVFIKGVASAAYYNEPDIRTMGDVDLLIRRQDTQIVNDLLQKLGYKTDEDIFKESGHVAYKRTGDGSISVCEVHFNLNGIPDSLSNTFENYLSTIFETAKEIEVMGKTCLVPSDFHHGIILLLHTATHLTSEGIGLRHLCDWAVFVNRFSNDEFVNVFEKTLKELGLWRFAQLLTLCSEKYLHIENKGWAGTADEVLLSSIVFDIISGGNFGFKDADRYRQIKYISNRESHKAGKKGVILQVFSSINTKAKTEYDFVKKHKILLPLGWVTVLYDYFLLVLTRKRKLDNINTINGAKHRQSIYKEFKLFEIDN